MRSMQPLYWYGSPASPHMQRDSKSLWLFIQTGRMRGNFYSEKEVLRHTMYAPEE